MSRAIRFAPLALLLVLLAGLVWRLATPTDTTVPSKLEGKPVPAFDTMGRPLESPAGTAELPSVRAQAFLQLANERMRSNQLVGRDGALGYLLNARQIDPSGPAIVDAIIQMAHSLQLEVVAEGVESEQQLDFLRKHGCDYAQGHLFGDPVTADQFGELLILETEGSGKYRALFA